VCYPDKSYPAGEASQNLTVNQTQIKRKRGDQKGNRNARKHGFYSATSRLPRCPSPYDKNARVPFGIWHSSFICHLDFVIWTLFVIWALAFELYLSFASMRQSASPRLAIINGNPMKRIVRTLTTKRQSASPRLAIINGNPMKRIVRTLTTKRQSASPRLAKINGNPTKRIVRILTAKSATGSHLTYEKELLNSRKNSHFYKTNHPGKGNNGGLGGLMEDPITIQTTTFFAYMPRMTLLSVSRSFYLPVTKSKVRFSSLAGVTRW
jgi:hypothetical protein